MMLISVLPNCTNVPVLQSHQLVLATIQQTYQSHTMYIVDFQF